MQLVNYSFVATSKNYHQIFYGNSAMTVSRSWRGAAGVCYFLPFHNGVRNGNIDALRLKHHFGIRVFKTVPKKSAITVKCYQRKFCSWGTVNRCEEWASIFSCDRGGKYRSINSILFLSIFERSKKYWSTKHTIHNQKSLFWKVIIL